MAGWGGGQGALGVPTCELTAQQLHPEGAVPPAHLGVQPDVLGLDGRREGVGVRGVVVHVAAEHLRGSKFAKLKKKIKRVRRIPGVSEKHCSVCEGFYPNCSCLHCPAQVFSEECPALVSHRDGFATCAEPRSLSCHSQKVAPSATRLCLFSLINI